YVFVGSIFTNGRDLDVTAQGSIEVQSNVVLSTRNTGGSIDTATAATLASQGNSGALSLNVVSVPGVLVSPDAPPITIDSGAQLLANAGSNFAAGDVSLKAFASQISINVPLLANFGLDIQAASIDVSSGVSIKGDDVTLSAQSSDVNPLDAINKDIGDS